MDDIRGSLSKMKNKLKVRLTERKPKPDGTGTSPGGDRTSAAGEQALSPDRPLQAEEPESAPAYGGDDDQEGEETDVDAGEASQRHLDPRPDVEVVMGSGRSGELKAVFLSPSSPPIPHDEKPDST